MHRHAARHASVLCLGTLFLTLAAHEARAAEEVPPPPGATPPPPDSPAPAAFGQRGELVISTNASLAIIHDSGGHSSTTSVWAQPAADYFVADHLSIGGSVSFQYSHSDELAGSVHTVAYGIGPRVGYDIPLSPRFSLWPRVTFSFQTETEGGTEGPSSTFSNEDLELFVPLLFHPATHFFVGFGPLIQELLPNQSQNPVTTVVGGDLTVGGWAGL